MPPNPENATDGKTGAFLTLQRLWQSDIGTYGLLKCKHRGIVAFTCELPWNDNRAFSSCIPEGRYQCVKHHSGRLGDVFWVRDVPERTAIYIHAANVPHQLEGCIAVGRHFAAFEGEQGVDYSRDMLAGLRLVYYDGFELTIKPP